MSRIAEPVQPDENEISDEEQWKKSGCLSYGDLRRIAVRTRRYLVEGLIPEGVLGIVVGDWGIGKSPLMVQLLLAVSAGLTTFLSRYPITCGAVPTLYVDLENLVGPMATLGERLSSHLGLEGTPELARIYSPNYTHRQHGDPMNMLGSQYIQNRIKDGGFKLIVIDPLRLYDPDAESKNKHAVEMIRRLRTLIRTTRATILLVHHPRKQNDAQIHTSLDQDPHGFMEEASGASALVKNTDIRIGLQEDRDGYLLMRHFERMNGWSPVNHLVRVFDDDDEPIGYQLALGLDRLDLKARTEFDKLPATFTTGDARKLLNLVQNPMNQRLKQWVALGLVRKVARGQWEKIPAGLGQAGEQSEQRP